VGLSPKQISIPGDLQFVSGLIRIRKQDRAPLDDLLEPMHEQIVHAHLRGPVEGSRPVHGAFPKVRPDV
jgi:hypothetical protein